MKPTFGRIGHGPHDPFDTGLTSVSGPMVRSVRDAARYLDATSGRVLSDPTSLPKPDPYEPIVADVDRARDLLRGLRVAWTSTLGYAETDRDVEASTRAAAEALIDAAGLELVDVPIEFPKPGRAWGVLGAGNTAAWYYDRSAEALDDLDLLARVSIEGLPHLRAAPPRRRDPAPPGDPRRVGRAVRAGRPAAARRPRRRPRTRPRARSSARSTARSSTSCTCRRRSPRRST